MERSRSKRYYYDQDYESETLHSRSKPRYNNNSQGGDGGGGHHYAPSYRRSSSSSGGWRKLPDQVMAMTSYWILCHDVKAGGVIRKSGSIIKAIRQHTGAWINVHELVPGMRRGLSRSPTPGGGALTGGYRRSRLRRRRCS